MRVRFLFVLALLVSGGCGGEAPADRAPGTPTSPSERPVPPAPPRPDVPAGGVARAHALMARPLTAEDVETWLVLFPQTRGRSVAEWKAPVEARGLTIPEWTMLQARVNAAYMALKSGVGPVAEQHRDDVEVVLPYQERIEAALRDR